MEPMTEVENTKPELPENVRVRFCPSPTGIPHVGMVRTALFNWAEARATGGTLIFRIEDTDAVRDSEESYNQILESLRWLGIDWDEGIDVGGPHGPYRQSERGDIYKDVAAKLLEAGYAYESFSTPEEIEARNVAAGRPKAFGYDGYDRNLTEEQKAAFRAEGRKPALRIRMPDEDVAFDDLIRGRIEFKAGSVPDYVIVRPNGDPLYTLTNPVDDAMMRINVVLRGEDLLSSTPRQIVLYRYLIELGVAKEMPLFGHMPYVMGQGNKKLSKRDPESNLFLHRDNGFIREGLLNYLALLGWSIAPDRDVFSMDEMIEKFSVIKTLQAVEQANVVVLVLDASQEISDQDAHIGGFVVEAGRMAVVLVEVFGRESFVIPFEEFRLLVIGDDRKEKVFIRAVGVRQFVVLDDRGDEIVEHHIGNTLLAVGLVFVDPVVQRTDFIVHHEIEVGEQLGCVAAQHFVDQEFVLPVQQLQGIEEIGRAHV